MDVFFITVGKTTCLLDSCTCTVAARSDGRVSRTFHSVKIYLIKFWCFTEKYDKSNLKTCYQFLDQLWYTAVPSSTVLHNGLVLYN